MPNEDLSEMGYHVATVLAEKVIGSIDGFPSPNPEAERKAIAQEIAHRLADHYEKDTT